ncbi:phage/plasmid primase, P4 family [Haladaptatus sp. DJG-WS-42]|uniref:DNA primase family protein n=1 Tax=Haladaptatus sp. DJG-WS-42 TaxID=3120516 RepID=UPI0030D18CF9
MNSVELNEQQEILVNSITNSPEDWVAPDEHTIYVRETGDHTADEMVKMAEESLDFSVLTAIDQELEDKYVESFLHFIRNKDVWTVQKETPQAQWRHIREMYDERGRKKKARLAAVEQLQSEFTFATMREAEKLYWYRDEKGVFEDQTKQLLKEHLDKVLQEFYSKTEVNHLIDRIKAQTYVDRDDFRQPDTKICVENGVVDLTTGTLEHHSPEHHFRWHLPVEYDGDADCDEFQNFLGQVCPAEKVPMLQEFVGYSLQPKMDQKKAMVIFGPTDAGKSVLLDVIQSLFGFENTTNLSVQYLANERWGEAELIGTPVNVSDDLSTNDIRNGGKFKKLVAGNGMTAERKHEKPFSFRPRTKHIFSANRAPKHQADDDGFWNRWLTIVFPNSIPRSEQDPQLTKRLTTSESLSGVLNWAIQGFQRLEEQGKFSNEPTPAESRNIWDRYGSSVEQFYQNCLERDSGAFVTKSDAYTAYKQYTDSENLEPVSKREFTSQLKRRNTVGESQRRVDGEKPRVFTGIMLQKQA